MPYRDLEIDHLLSKGGHLVVEAEPVFPDFVGREHEVPLSLLGAFHDDLLIGADDRVVDVEGAPCLHLVVTTVSQSPAGVFGATGAIRRSRMRSLHPFASRR